MKMTTAMMIGVFTMGSGFSLADHRYDQHDHYQFKSKHHHKQAQKKATRHERKAEKHMREARKHYRKAQRHDRVSDRYTTISHHRQNDNFRSHKGNFGRVVNVEPIYRSYTRPVQSDSCRSHDGYNRGNNSYTGTVLGAVIGGALGHRIGDSHGDADVAAVAGGLLGASVGHNIDRRVSYNRGVRVDGPCRVRQHTETVRELVEYKVSYRYNGSTHHTRMDYDPGEWVKLNVEVSPV